jgi:hypothetical protein
MPGHCGKVLVSGLLKVAAPNNTSGISSSSLLSMQKPMPKTMRSYLQPSSSSMNHDIATMIHADILHRQHFA